MNKAGLTRREMLKTTGASLALLGAQDKLLGQTPFQAELERPEIVRDATRATLRGGSPVRTVSKDAGGLQIRMATGLLRLEPWGEGIIRVQYSPSNALPQPATSAVLPNTRPCIAWHADLANADSIALFTPGLTAIVDRASGALTFKDSSGNVLLQEPRGGGRSMEPVIVKGEPLWQTEQTFLSPADESLYGLGGFWHGFLDHKGDMVQLVQTNPCDISPVLVSSQGYAMLWDNASRGEFRACREPVLVPASAFRLPDGTGAGLHAEYSTEGDHSKVISRVDSHIDFSWSPGTPAIPGLFKGRFSATWKGKLNVTAGGDYFFLLRSGNLGARLVIDRKMVIENWIAHDDLFDTGHVNLTPGLHEVQIEFYGNPERLSELQLKWIPPSPPADQYTWAAEAASAIDYYVIRAEDVDTAIAGYRQLTGSAPLFPISSYGLWHSQASWKGDPGKNNEIPNTQANMIAVAEEYRRRRIPVDTIVQDFQYWTKMGAHDFRHDTHPDPVAMMQRLHELHFKLMISIWCLFDPGTANEQEMQNKGYMLYPISGADWDRNPNPAPAWYNPWESSARATYWRQVRDHLFNPQGIQADAFWMDSTEGGGPIWRANEYPLKAGQAVFEGWTKSESKRRVTIIGRSIFPGIQRYGVALWSGDIGTDIWSLSRQISNGLGVCMTGLPYWTTDIGGFGGGFAASSEWSYGNNPQDPRYVETYVRWLQFGSFCPLFRLHSAGHTDAPWYFGTQAEAICTSYINLRYRLLPYIYSLAWRVTNQSYTIMRALPMDFMSDKAVRKITDQFMFGPALLANPVTELHATSRELYLPAGTWYDFWTGRTEQGGRTLTANAPLETMPLYVRAGSILPMGPVMQHTGEKPSDPIELRIYSGADGAFTLYEDDRNTYNYQDGQYSEIDLLWHDATETLTISQHKGAFAGMLEKRTFRVARVRVGSGIGIDEAASVQTISYDGSQISVRCGVHDA
jgi:alpha-D-xyloside xylohydrolase